MRGDPFDHRFFVDRNFLNAESGFLLFVFIKVYPSKAGVVVLCLYVCVLCCVLYCDY